MQAEFTLFDSDGSAYLPHRVRGAARLKDGDVIEVEIVDEGILLRPRRILRQARAWSGARQRLTRLQMEALKRQTATGDGRIIYQDEEFLDALAEMAAEADEKRSRPRIKQ